MALQTHSKFYFGYTVNATNTSLDFDEGGGELQASVSQGGYSYTELGAAIQNAMNEVGGQVYTVTTNRDDRTYTISASGTFDLLINSGSRSGSSVFSLAGFTGADVTGAITYTSNLSSGSEYTTQLMLQDYIPSSDFQGAQNAAVNEAASGEIEVVTFGSRLNIQMNFKFITDYPMGNSSIIRNRPTGVSDFRTFIQFMITKARFEFMPDENDADSFEKVILESTPDDSNGISYKLNELVGRGLPGFYDSGIMTLRVIS